MHTLYGRLINANIEWDYPVVERRDGKDFLTHDILKSMDLIEPGSQFEGDEEIFDDDPDSLFKKMADREEKDRQIESARRRDVRSPPALDMTMQTPTAPMSRMSSMDSMQYNMSYPTLDKPQMPVLQQYNYGPGGPHYQRAPGGHLPPTPTESPSKERPSLSFHQTQPELDLSNQVGYAAQPGLLTTGPPAPGLFVTTQGIPWEPPTYTHPLNQHMGQPSPHMQYSALPLGQPMQMSAPGGPPTTLAQPYESPMFAPSGLPDQLSEDQPVWNTAVFQTANDPDMGYSQDPMNETYPGGEPHFEL